MTRADFILELLATLHGVEYYIDSDGGAVCLVAMGTCLGSAPIRVWVTCINKWLSWEFRWRI